MGDRSSLDNYNSPNTIVCNCGKEESEHTFAGGTLEQDKEGRYICDGYDQTKLRRRKDVQRPNRK